MCNEIMLIAQPVRCYIFKYPLLVDLVEIFFSSYGIAVVFSAEDTRVDPSLGCYNGGRCGILNLKCFSGLHEVGHFIRPGTHVFKTVKPVDEA